MTRPQRVQCQTVAKKTLPERSRASARCGSIVWPQQVRFKLGLALLSAFAV